MGKQWKQYTETLFSWAPKSLQMVIAARKLKDHCSLEEKLWPISVQFSLVTQSCPSVRDPMDHSTPGLPIHHQLPEFTQTHVHWVGDAIQPSHPLSCPSPAFNLSQHQGLFEWVSSSYQVAKILEFQLQHHPSNEHSGLISFRMDWLDLVYIHNKNILCQRQASQKHHYF